MTENTQSPKTVQRIFYRLVHIVLICAILCVITLPTSAQVYAIEDTYHDNNQFPYNPRRSTIYQPFSDATPRYSAGRFDDGAIGDDEETNNPGTPGVPDWGEQEKNDNEFPDGFWHPDDPNKPYHEPVGEAWIMLLFAAIMAIIVYRRSKRVHSENI